MVWNISDRLVRFHESFQRRTQPLSENARKKRTAVIVLSLGILLGLWAYRSSTIEAKLAWLRDHPPSDTFWQKTLKERGFVPVLDPHWWDRASLEFPARKPNSPNVWISENRRLFIRYGVSGWEAWGLQDANPPIPDRHLFEAIGYGWDAIDFFVGLDLPITRVAFEKKRTREWNDPRAIRY